MTFVVLHNGVRNALRNGRLLEDGIPEREREREREREYINTELGLTYRGFD